jgi:DNA-binding transcriptional LysR family regulator
MQKPSGESREAATAEVAAPRPTTRVFAEVLELRQLRRFLAVLDYGSFARAADVLCLTQQAISASIIALEEALGVPLFTRSDRGSIATVYGRKLEPHARAMVATAQRTKDMLLEVKESFAGVVRIGVSEVLSARVIPRALARFMHDHPNVQVTLREGNSQRMLELLRHGQLDLIVGAPPTTLSIDDGIEQDFLFEDRDCVVVRRDHPLASEDPLTLRSLARYPWIVSANRPEDFQFLTETLLARGLTPPERVVRSDALAAGLGLILEDDYVALTAPLFPPAIIGGPEAPLIARWVEGIDRRRTAFVRYLRDPPLGPVARRLIDEIRRASVKLPVRS